MIEFMKTHDKAKIPQRQTEGAAGFDLHYSAEHAETVYLHPGQSRLFPTGVKCAIPENWCGLILPRSGWAVNFSIDKLAGLVDEDWRGEVGVVLINHGLEVKTIEPGDRIAQMIVTPYMKESKEVTKLSETVRGNGGFGSTGVK